MAANVLQLPALVYLKKLYNNYKSKQDELRQRKISFLFNQAYQNFYEQYLIQHSLKDYVDLPAFVYAKRDATEKAIEVMLNVIKNGRVNQCYRARVEELKKMGLKK